MHIYRTSVSSFFVYCRRIKGCCKKKVCWQGRVVDALLAKMNYEYVYTPEILDETLFEIRDAKDYPVLCTAILEDVDIFVTGDNDFTDVDVDKPEILTPTQFVERYVKI